jgi:hypothetical protein
MYLYYQLLLEITLFMKAKNKGKMNKNEIKKRKRNLKSNSIKIQNKIIH